jgi:RecB family exonuclease
LAQNGGTIEELLWEAWSSSPVAKSWPKDSRTGGILGQEANRNLDAILELFTMAKRSVEREPLRPAADFIASVLRAELPEDTLAAQSNDDAVLVCTPAAVIGAEYDIVAVSAVQEGIWPNLRLRGSLLHAPAITDDELPTDDQRAQVRSDELRMFALAVSRATSLVIISGVSGAEQLLSPFGRYIESLATLSGGDVNESSKRSTYPLTLRGIVGHQRRALTTAISEHGEHSPQAKAAAHALAQLATHEVPGATPSSWYGTRGVSTTLPVALLNGDARESVYVSPSRLEKWQENQLAWFLSTTVGYEGSASTGIGMLLHAVFEHAAAQPVGVPFDGDSLWNEIAPRWKEIEFEAVWEADKEQRRVRGMCQSLATYLNKFAESGKRVVGVESSLSISVGKGVLQGRADRLEAGPEGIEVIDLKSSKTPKNDTYAATNMQLACYQYAVVSGGFKIVDGMCVEPEKNNPADEGPFEPQKSAGARLLYLNNVTKDGFSPKLASQAPMTESESSDPAVLSVDFMRQILEKAIEGMASGEYSTTVYTREVDGDFNSGWTNRIHTIRSVSS